MNILDRVQQLESKVNLEEFLDSESTIEARLLSLKDFSIKAFFEKKLLD